MGTRAGCGAPRFCVRNVGRNNGDADKKTTRGTTATAPRAVRASGRRHDPGPRKRLFSKIATAIPRTIEGNTNDDGSREGYEVCARTRDYNEMDFIKI